MLRGRGVPCDVSWRGRRDVQEACLPSLRCWRQTLTVLRSAAVLVVVVVVVAVGVVRVAVVARRRSVPAGRRRRVLVQDALQRGDALLHLWPLAQQPVAQPCGPTRRAAAHRQVTRGQVTLALVWVYLADPLCLSRAVARSADARCTPTRAAQHGGGGPRPRTLDERRPTHRR